MSRLAVVLLILAGCQPPADGDPGEVGSVTQVLIAPIEFNGGFEQRDFPPASSCSTLAQPRCPPPTSLPAGWTVTPLEHFRSAKGHGTMLFLYGNGRNSGPINPDYGVPHGTSAMFQMCFLSHDPEWCGGTTTIISPRFGVVSGSPYRLSLWMRASAFMGAFGQPSRVGTTVVVRFFANDGADLGADAAQFSPDAIPVDWTENARDLLTPERATDARVEITVDRARNSWVFADDVSITPL